MTHFESALGSTDPSPAFSSRFYLVSRSLKTNPLVYHLRGKDAGPNPKRVLLAAAEVAKTGAHERGIALAEAHLPSELAYTANILKANAALAKGDEAGWQEHLNAYLTHFDVAPICLDAGEGTVFDRLNTAPLTPVTDGPLVTVIMPAWNAEKTVRKAAQSILNQTWRNLELLIVDDASSDSTWSVLQNIAASDERVKIFHNKVNVGPYVSKNIALKYAQGVWFTGQDADDWSHPTRLEKHIHHLNSFSDPLFASHGIMIRIDLSGQCVDIAAVADKKHDGVFQRCLVSTIFNTELFRKVLNAYDCARFGADNELLGRLKLCTGRNIDIFYHLSMICVKTPGSLTDNDIYGIGNDRGVTLERKAYRSAWRKAHESLGYGAWIRYSFPPVKANEGFPFIKNNIANVDHSLVEMAMSAEDDDNKPINVIRSRERKPIICGVATLFERRHALEETINSILPQVDKLIVYQNDYYEVFDFLRHKKIEVVSAFITGIDMGDAGKFYRVQDYDDVIYFSIDDDLVYPSNYVRVLYDQLSSHGFNVIVSAHGRICKPKVVSYYDDKVNLFHFGKKVESIFEVHFGGTGVMAFSTKRVKVKFSDFKQPNMADIWLELLARNACIPILTFPHADNWIKHSQKFDMETTIFHQATKEINNKMTKVSKVINSLLHPMDFSDIYGYDLRLGETRSLKVLKNMSKKYRISSSLSITIAIPTFNRRDLLIRLVNQLDLSAVGFMVNVVIFDDGSKFPVDSSWFNTRHLNNIEVLRFNNHGKKRYWSLVNNILDKLSDQESDYYFFLGDDLEIKENFFFDAINSWESIADNNKISLNLLIDPRTQSWTSFERVKKNFSGFEVYQTQWLDMIMIFNKRLLSQVAPLRVV